MLRMPKKALLMGLPKEFVWVPRSIPESNSWVGVDYNGSVYCAIASTGTNRIMTSPTGATWTARSIDANTWGGIAFGAGLFVAVSQDGTNRIMSSPDGATWTARTPPVTAAWTGIAFGNGYFVAVSSTTATMRSTDGMSWSSGGATLRGYDRVFYGNGVFVAMQSSGTGSTRVARSADNGASWAGVSSGGLLGWSGGAYGMGRWIIVAGAEGAKSSTNDAVTFATQTLSGSVSCYGICSGGGLFVGGAETSSLISPDGLTFTAKATGVSGTIFRVFFYGGGRFIALANNGTTRLMTAEW
jgi:hypothetical protein